MTSIPDDVRMLHDKFNRALPDGVHANYGLFRARAFETPAEFHIRQQSDMS